MLIGARQLFFMKKKLPYDAEVEYLESNGGPYIDTGLPIVNNTGYQVEVEFRFLNYTSGVFSEDWVFGYWNSQPSPRIYLIGRYTNYIRGGAGPDNSTYYVQMNRDTNKHKIALMNDGAYLDGVYKVPTKLNEIANPIYGFSNVILGKSPHVDNGSTRRIYSCKMWAIDDTLLRDFIPVRFTNQLGRIEGAMYDRVTKTLFKNAGTGTFEIGPDITTAYDSAVEYLGGTGTQYIDTGVYGQNNMLVGCRFKVWDLTVVEAESDTFPFLARRGARRMCAVLRVGQQFGMSAMTAFYNEMNLPTAFFGAWHTVELDSTTEAQSATLDGVQLHTWTTTESDPTYQPIALFAARNTTLEPQYIGKGHISSFYAFDKLTNTTLIDLYAVRFTNQLGQSEGAMYDRVTKTLFKNAGTGTFEIGPDIT